MKNEVLSATAKTQISNPFSIKFEAEGGAQAQGRAVCTHGHPRPRGRDGARAGAIIAELCDTFPCLKLYTLVRSYSRLSWRNAKPQAQREHSTARTAHGHSMSARVSSCINATMITVALTEETRDHLRCTLSTLASLAAESARESGHISPPSAASRYPRPPREPSCRRKQSSSSVAGMCTPWSHCRARTAATDAARSPRHRAWMLKGGGVGEL